VLVNWLDQLRKIASKHYLMVTEDDFKKATHSSAKCSAALTGTGQHELEKKRHNPLSDQGVMRRPAMACQSVQHHQAERTGFEQVPKTPTITQFSNQAARNAAHFLTKHSLLIPF
jgi:hypothetical protein